MASLASSARNFRLMLVYDLSQHTPLYWPYMFMFVTQVRGLPASDFGLLKALYYFGVMLAEVPLGVVADRIGRRPTLVLGALSNSCGCALYAWGADFSAYAAAEVLFALTTSLQSGADSALLYDAYAADDRTSEFPRALSLIESSNLIGATAAFALAGLLVTADGDSTATWIATGILSLAGAAAALGMREPPRVSKSRLSRHVVDSLRDLLHTKGLVATIAYSALVYAALRAANALVWNPVLERAGVRVGFWGALTAAVTLIGALAAWRAPALRERLGTRGLAIGVAGSLVVMYGLLGLAPVSWDAPVLVSHGLALGIAPVLIVDLLNRRIHASERRATLLSFESMFQRGTYGVLVYAASSALEASTLSLVLLGFALLAAIPLLLAPRLRD